MRKKPKYEKRHTIGRVIHKPTYCVLQVIDPITEKPPAYERHHLSPFSSKKEIQSTQSQSAMKNALNWMLMFAEPKRVYSKKPWVNRKGELQHNFHFRLAFITLTLSGQQAHTDKHIKEHMLQPFLYFITRYHKANYVWKAETQLNGNIHFHITIDTFIHWKVIRRKWNQILARHSYCKVFQDGTNDKGDSATQIKAIKNEDGMAKCIGGYLTKNSIEEKYHNELIKKRTVKIEELLEHSYGITCNIENKMHYTRFVEGRLWGCSESLSGIKCFTDELDTFYDLQKIEKEFFHTNKLQRLSNLMIEKEKKNSGPYSYHRSKK